MQKPLDPQAAQTMQQELRQDLLPWVLLPVVGLGLVLALADLEAAPPPSPTGLGLLLLTLAGSVWYARHGSFRVGAWLLTLGTLACVLLAHWWLGHSDTRHLLLLPVLVAGILLGAPFGAALSGVALLVLAAWAPSQSTWSARVSLLLPDVVLFAVSAYLLWVWQRSQVTIISWAWHGYAEARKHLEAARDRQVELKRALEDLALAHAQTARLNDQLVGARSALEDARRAKEEFVANVSHELRTPLNMIIGFSDEILERPEVYSRRLPTSLLSDVAAIRRNSEHLAHLVDDVLELAEAETGRMQLFLERIRMQDVAREAVEAVAALFHKKRLALTVDVADGLPSIVCDRARIRQVLLNLLSNAGRFTDKGGATVRVQPAPGAIVVSVEDTGPGMAPAQIEHLFEPFQQADPSIRRRYGGTGLGLAISKRFVELHHGTIWLESEPGRGTRACFTLPLQDPLPATAAQRWFSPYHEFAARTRPSSAPGISPAMRVAVVEEADILARQLSRHANGLEAVSVRTLSEAAQRVEIDGAAAVVINTAYASDDATHSAAPVSRDLGARTLDVPVFSCSVPRAWERLAKLGVLDYLVKPIRRATLMDSISRIAPGARSALVVEDDPEALALFARMFRREPGGDVSSTAVSLYTAADVVSGLACLRDKHPDILLLDLFLPGLDGYALLDAKAHDGDVASIPTIVISAQDPRREPLVSRELTLTRHSGLGVRDLALAIRALLDALQPRFGMPGIAEDGAPEGT